MIPKTKTLNFPLCVDLDGTLIREDVTQLTLLQYLKQNPLRSMKVLFWFLKGRAFLKKKLAEYTEIDVSSLSFNAAVIELIKEAKKKGQPVVLATAADRYIAQKVAQYCGFFDDVIASDGYLNQRAAQKAETLMKAYGEKNFIYVGNSKDDLKVWPHAKKAIAANASCSVARKLKNLEVSSEILS
ncbi:MAG: haloacid dehalogenase-like hydrolase [Proteobacteria bacterium]|nr:haloacid dehalogenase-like hydrolase [Pseudomonadota bacterium]